MNQWVLYLLLINLALIKTNGLCQEFTSIKESKGKWGLVHGSDTLTEFMYDSICVNLSSYFFARLDSLWGVLDSNGRPLLQCEFEEIKDLLMGNLRVKMHGHFGVIDTSGFYHSRIVYQDIDHISKDSIILVRDGTEWKYVKNDKDVFREKVVFKNPDRIAIYGVCQAHTSNNEMKECSNINISRMVVKNLKYPKNARRNNISGFIVLSFWISPHGHVENIVVIKDIGYGCGSEGVEVVRLLDKWQPAIKDNEPVWSEFVLPMRFVLK